MSANLYLGCNLCFFSKFKLKSIVQKTKVLARNKVEIGKMKTEAYLNFFLLELALEICVEMKCVRKRNIMMVW